MYAEGLRFLPTPTNFVHPFFRNKVVSVLSSPLPNENTVNIVFKLVYNTTQAVYVQPSPLSPRTRWDPKAFAACC